MEKGDSRNAEELSRDRVEGREVLTIIIRDINSIFINKNLLVYFIAMHQVV